MLIGNVIENAKVDHSWEIAANKLSDKVRNLWLEHRGAGMTNWEESFSETPALVDLIRRETLPKLTDIEYIFKWWNVKDPDELSGEVNVVWTLTDGENSRFYLTWARLAERDFIIGPAGGEIEKREQSREEYREAFGTWISLLEKK